MVLYWRHKVLLVCIASTVAAIYCKLIAL
uniref:Uncharacterized protein n=1 Tax=Anguilla anguilla TaxID=7936 RepID=A0A0E9R0N9_ANGAN